MKAQDAQDFLELFVSLARRDSGQSDAEVILEALIACGEAKPWQKNRMSDWLLVVLRKLNISRANSRRRD